MNSKEIFALALNTQHPWKINRVEFVTTAAGKRELQIEMGYEKGSQFPDDQGTLCSVYDSQPRQWRHLNFFQHACYLSCKVPRIKTPDGKVKLVEVPWSRPHSGFTLLFEGYIMLLIESETPLNKIGHLVCENAHRLWLIFNYWVGKAYAADDPSGVTHLGIDETSRRKGHEYITLSVDLETRRVLHVTEGKSKESIEKTKDYLVSKGLSSEAIKHVSVDMSPSFIAGTKTHFPNAAIHFDRFHVVKLLNEAMDTVRKQERKEHDELKGKKYLFLKNKKNLSDRKTEELSKLITLYPTLGAAYRLKILFNTLWEMDTPEAASLFLDDWFAQVEASGIPAFKKFSKMVKSHRSGIINFCGTQINNGILEGINTKVQLAKRRARGFRRLDNFINMIYFLCSKLKFDYPLYSS